MRRFFFLASLLVFFSAAAEEGFVNLFNGKDLTGWENPYEWGEVSVVGDEVHMNTKKKKFFLCTEKKYKDFIFEVEIKMPEGKSNSGVLFRCMKKKNKAWGYQAECDPSSRKWSGGLYDEGRRKWMHPDRDFKVGTDEFFTKNLSPEWTEEKKNAFKRHDWNKYRIECKGSEIKISINGVLTTHIFDSKDADGYIGLQHHGEKGKLYKFKNAKIKELK
ncbi:MAG: DUF1080 domain-containing protein [Lentisphaeraceae bacterium]|nr:DUF1080 domain-containing protein [Lentisphaeraceae bacterium]